MTEAIVITIVCCVVIMLVGCLSVVFINRDLDRREAEYRRRYWIDVYGKEPPE